MNVQKVSMICLCFLLFGFRCSDNNFEPTTTEPPAMRIRVRPNAVRIRVGDTLWMSCTVTSKVFDFMLKDSVTYKPHNSYLYFYRMRHPASGSDYNTTPAAKSFTYYPSFGQVATDQTQAWNDYRMVFAPELTTGGSFFSFRIGVIPQTPGIFAILNQNSAFNVEQHNSDLYLPFGSIYTNSFAATYPKGVGWYPIDSRLYFFEVESVP